MIGSYIHATGKVGALVAVACETDFVARGSEFKQLVHDLAMHVAASNPLYLQRADVPTEVIAKEKEIAKYYADTCLLDQPFVKDEDITVAERIRQAIAKTGENVQVKKFIRFSL